METFEIGKLSNISVEGKKSDYHLIVDDSEINRLVLRKYLTRIGEKYIEVTNGKESLSVINNYPFYIIWMDVRMPVMNGIDTTKKLRELGYNNYIIGITGQVDPETHAECLQAGMSFVIAKPVLPVTIYNIIDDINNGAKQIVTNKKIEN